MKYAQKASNVPLGHRKRVFSFVPRLSCDQDSAKTSLADSERTSAFSSILTVFGRHAAPLLEVVAWLVR